MKCEICDEHPAGPNGEICYACSMTALRAFGWAQGTSTPDGGLLRGPECPAARRELDGLVEKRKRRRATEAISEIEGDEES